jgi:hypothetical protein
MNIIINGIEYAPVNKEEELIPVTLDYTFSIEIYPVDLGNMNWYDAMDQCRALNTDPKEERIWRLPSRIELFLMYANAEIITNLKKDVYLSLDQIYPSANFAFNFSTSFVSSQERYSAGYVRPVKDLNIAQVRDGITKNLNNE